MGQDALLSDGQQRLLLGRGLKHERDIVANESTEQHDDGQWAKDL